MVKISQWFWQDYLYENLNASLTIDSDLFGRLFKNIEGIIKVMIDNEYSIGFEYDDSKFSEGSKEFQQLLNFANYFIRSKRIDGK